MSEKLHIPFPSRFVAKVVLAGVCVLPFVLAEHAEGRNLVSARVQVVSQSRKSRTAVAIETANYGSYRGYNSSRGYGSSGCGGSGRGYGYSSRQYSPRIAPRRHWERRTPYRSYRGRPAPHVSRRVETYSREEYESYGSRGGDSCSHGQDSRRGESYSRRGRY